MPSTRLFVEIMKMEQIWFKNAVMRALTTLTGCISTMCRPSFRFGPTKYDSELPVLSNSIVQFGCRPDQAYWMAYVHVS